MIFEAKEKFHLSERFLDQYKDKQPNWGPLGYVTFKRTYAREIPNQNRSEEYWETLKRVVEGCYTVQMNHCKNLKLPWQAMKSQKSAQEMFKLMWNFKFLPPGRGLWAMGTEVVWIKGGGALNSCAFASTKDLNFDFSGPFTWLMDMSMLGVGVAFDTKGFGKIVIKDPKVIENTKYTVPDSKEGWCELVGMILDAYDGKGSIPGEIDYSLIRPEGAPIKTFGGIAPGPEPLKQCVKEIRTVLDRRIGQNITSGDITDLMNIVGKCVVSGGVRRTAELALGNWDDEEYIDLKNPEKYPKEMKEWRWASNNSVYASEGMDYTTLAPRTATNGEPGYVYLDNVRKYGRIKDGVNWKDKAAEGVNPCGEQSLENYELCNLCELFPTKHTDLEDFIHTIKYAYLYAKTVTLIPTHSERTNQVLLRNRRIGLSLSGIVDAFEKFGRREFLKWCDEGYEYVTSLDEKYSRWLCIPRSIKMTTVKPSGTVSLLPGVSPGIHYPHSKFYKRRIRIPETSDLVKKLQKAGVENEPSVYNDRTIVFAFPVKTDNYAKGKREVTIWEQMENAAAIQYYWSDNNISQTVTIRKEEKDQVKDVLEIFEDRLKTVSFLPLDDHQYDQAPYEEITEDEYNRMLSNMKEIDLSDVKIVEESEEAKAGCTNDTCEITDFKKKAIEKEEQLTGVSK